MPPAESSSGSATLSSAGYTSVDARAKTEMAHMGWAAAVTLAVAASALGWHVARDSAISGGGDCSVAYAATAGRGIAVLAE